MRPFLTSLFRKKRTLSLPLYALLFICFASESFDGYFLPSILFVYFRFDFFSFL